MKSKLFLMRTVKSRALPRFNETFYFLLCRVIASFKSSSTTCQARSCMIINIQQTWEILFFCNGFKIFELQLKLLNSNSTELSVLFYICSNNLKQKKSDLYSICFECNLKYLKGFEFFQIVKIPYMYRIRCLVYYCGPFTPIRYYQFSFNFQIFRSIFNSIFITLLRFSGITLSLNFFQRSVVNQK